MILSKLSRSLAQLANEVATLVSSRILLRHTKTCLSQHSFPAIGPGMRKNRLWRPQSATFIAFDLQCTATASNCKKPMLSRVIVVLLSRWNEGESTIREVSQNKFNPISPSETPLYFYTF